MLQQQAFLYQALDYSFKAAKYFTVALKKQEFI
jgi:hypothetical protein